MLFHIFSSFPQELYKGSRAKKEKLPLMLVTRFFSSRTVQCTQAGEQRKKSFQSSLLLHVDV
jgi:hypothetical protein